MALAATALSDADKRIEDFEATAAGLEGELVDLADRVSDAEDAVEEATAMSDEAVAAMNAMALEFDDEIRAAAAAAQDDAIGLACSEARQAVRDGDRVPVAPLIAATVLAPLVGVDLELDLDPIRDELDRCASDEGALIDAEEKQADLVSDKGNGFYTVGEEIAPGLWHVAALPLSGDSGEFRFDVVISANKFSDGSRELLEVNVFVEAFRGGALFADCGTAANVSLPPSTLDVASRSASFVGVVPFSGCPQIPFSGNAFTLDIDWTGIGGRFVDNVIDNDPGRVCTMQTRERPATAEGTVSFQFEVDQEPPTTVSVDVTAENGQILVEKEICHSRGTPGPP